MRPSDELAALHAPLDDGSRHPDIRHAADAVPFPPASTDDALRGDNSAWRDLVLVREGRRRC